MHVLDRRQFSAGIAALATFSLSAPAIAERRARLVVIGGGPGGATVAGHVKSAAPELEVTLLEPQKHYISCFFSNHYLGGFRDLASLTHRYDGLAKLGVRVVHRKALDIDIAKKLVRLDGGEKLPFDRLVVAPGIDFKLDKIEGYSEATAEAMPHAWKGGRQSQLLRRKIEAMPDGGVVLISAPRNPYRCPPGPYERACVIAHYLKTEKPKSKLIIVDPKMSFSKQPVFEEAFSKYYKSIVDLHLTNDIDDMSVVKVDAKKGEVTVKAGTTFKVAVANIVPDQKAGDIACKAGLVEGDWCPVHPENFVSAKAPGIYIVGDAAVSNEMPKSAFSANNQAKAVAADILAELASKERFPARYHNTCWSFLAPNDSVKIGANYAPGDTNGKHLLVPSGSFVSQPGESAAVRKENYDESVAWYAAITEDIFAKTPPPGKSSKKT